MKKIFCSIICILICSMVQSQSISENFRKDPIKINTLAHSKPDSLYLRVTYTTEDNTGKKFISIRGDKDNHKFEFTTIATLKDSSGKKYKVLHGFRRDVFPGGLTAWNQYLKDHIRSGFAIYIKIPEGEVSAKQTVKVEFLIDSLGNTSDIKVLNENEVHPKIAEEAIRVIKQSPRWVPGLQEEFDYPDGAIVLHKIKCVRTKQKQSIDFESLRN